VTLLTVTPPLTLACSRLVKPAPGSKKPEPLTCVPVMVTFWPGPVTTAGTPQFGVAGGGARRRTTRTPYEFAESTNSWIVHIVMSSLGSTLV
jgi:hypothetical protein